MAQLSLNKPGGAPSNLATMKTKLLLFFGALVAACSLTSCDIYGYPTVGVYGGGSPYYSRPYYNSGFYGGPLFSSFGGFYSRPYYNTGYYNRSYSRPSYSSYNRNWNNNCAPTFRSSSFSSPLVNHSHHSSFGSSSRSFGGSSSFRGFGGGSSFAHHRSGGSSFSGGGHHHHMH